MDNNFGQKRQVVEDDDAWSEEKSQEFNCFEEDKGDEEVFVVEADEAPSEIDSQHFNKKQ